VAAQQTALPVKGRAGGIVDQNGSPVFWLGTTQWGFSRYSQEDAKTIIEESRTASFVESDFGVGDGTDPTSTARNHGSTTIRCRTTLYFRNVDNVPRCPRQ
jgi:hypothetical protein